MEPLNNIYQVTNNQEVLDLITYVPKDEQEIISTRINSMAYLKQIIILEINVINKKIEIDNLEKKNKELNKKINDYDLPKKPECKKIKSFKDFLVLFNNFYKKSLTYILSVIIFFFLNLLWGCLMIMGKNGSINIFINSIKEHPVLFIIGMVLLVPTLIFPISFLRGNNKDDNVISTLFIFAGSLIFAGIPYAIFIRVASNVSGYFILGLLVIVLNVIPTILAYFIKYPIVYSIAFIILLPIYLLYSLISSIIIKQHNNKINKDYEQLVISKTEENKIKHEKNDSKWQQQIIENQNEIDILKQTIKEIAKILKYYNDNIYYNSNKIYAVTLNKILIYDYLENGSANNLPEAIRFFCQDKNRIEFEEGTKKQLEKKIRQLESKIETQTNIIEFMSNNSGYNYEDD